MQLRMSIEPAYALSADALHATPYGHFTWRYTEIGVLEGPARRVVAQ